MFFKQLYVRIWLAVVLAVAVLTLLVGWAWRLTTEPPLREVVVRNEAGEVIGSGHARLRRPLQRGEPLDKEALGSAGGPPPPPPELDAPPDDDLPGRFGRGPEFLVRMQDGQTVHMHLPRPPASSLRAPFGFFWTLGLVGIAVALGTYPIVRRLTRRLETLRQGVERWGDGDLSARVPLGGDDEVGFLATRFHAIATTPNVPSRNVVNKINNQTFFCPFPWSSTNSNQVNFCSVDDERVVGESRLRSLNGGDDALAVLVESGHQEPLSFHL